MASATASNVIPGQSLKSHFMPIWVLALLISSFNFFKELQYLCKNKRLFSKAGKTMLSKQKKSFNKTRKECNQNKEKLVLKQGKACNWNIIFFNQCREILVHWTSMHPVMHFFVLIFMLSFLITGFEGLPPIPVMVAGFCQITFVYYRVWRVASNPYNLYRVITG